ncbi:MAG: hypothetical protein K2H32_02425 [Muribaculaceae bacterium]|nr:hypothetical protein [Muribaculaceae bacterium]
MLVKTVDINELHELCSRLAYEVYESAYHPDCILAVLNGGLKPAEIICKELSRLYNDNSIELIHVGVNKKNRNFASFQILRYFPIGLLNCLRIISLKIKRVVPFEKTCFIKVIIPARCQNILIVDDAIDTGKTLLSILNELNNVNFKTAVLTVTIDNPKVTPHYNLFKNVILRFPWARDAK